MKTRLHILLALVIGMSLSSCYIETNGYYNGVSLEQVMTDYDIWYVDYNRTTGSGNIPFLSKAFTISFINGRVYANNNLVGIGYTGNGYGIQIGTYNTYNGYLQVQHDLDGYYEFEVFTDTYDQIRLYNRRYNVTYYLEGYQKNRFDFDQVFYDNIEYFLQEYYAWEKTYTGGGTANMFDDENFLAFTPEDNTTFYSSKDVQGTSLNSLIWDYTGSYEVYDITGYDNLKYLYLNYSPSGQEKFELTVLNDGKIELYHLTSGTTYEFTGRQFLQFRMNKTSQKTEVSTERMRTKITRKAIERESVPLKP